MVGFGTGPFRKEDGSEATVRYIVTEVASKGELFDLVAETGGLSERTARFVMKSIFKAVSYMHAQGIANRDLKLENMLLDENFRVKLIDFGLCAPTAGRKGKGFLDTICGTE